MKFNTWRKGIKEKHEMEKWTPPLLGPQLGVYMKDLYINMIILKFV